MLIKGDKMNRPRWKIGIVNELNTGADGAMLRAGMFLCRLYLHSNRDADVVAW